ncbi:MAG: IS110 family transposase [Nitrospiraceae bacterium]
MHNSSTTTQPVAAWIGLDWADHQHALSLQDSQGGRVEHYQVEHSQLGQWVAGLQARWPGRTIALALEQSRGAVLYTLMGFPFLQIYPINPKSLARFRETFAPSGSKDDPADADLLRELMQKHGDRLRPWKADTVETRRLQLLVDYRRQSVNQRTRLTNQATSLLKCYYPVALQCAGGLDTLQAAEFLQRWPTLEALQKTAPGRLRQFYRRHGCRRQELIQQRLELIGQAQPLTTDPAIVLSLSLQLRTVVAQLQALIPCLKEFDTQIAAVMAQHPDHAILESFPGAGPALAPRLVAAFGTDRSRFASAQEIQKLSGIAPVTKKSGPSCWVHRRWACPKFLLQTFHEYARLSRPQSVWAEAFYQRKRAEGKKHHAAIRALAYQWIRILYRCWQDHTLYDEARYQQACRRRQLRRLIAAGPRPSAGTAASGKGQSGLVPVSTLLAQVLDELRQPAPCAKPVQSS